MKKIIFILIIVVLSYSCKKEKEVINGIQKTEKKAEIINNFDWLLGKWERVNEEEGKKTYENWVKINDKNITELVLP